MNQEKIGKFIAELRVKEGYTQKELGELLNITDNSVSKWERGINAPDISQLERIAEIFNITIDELLKGERKYKKKEKDKNRKKVLEVRELSKSFHNKKILNNISFQLYEGDIVGLIGPNGAGKTTLMKCILSLYKKDNGKIEIMGLDTTNHLEDCLKNVGSLIEIPCFYERLTGQKNISIIKILHNINDSQYIDSLIKELELEKYINQKVKTYSLGMKERLGLVCSLINKPKLLLLDEPTNGLDPIGIKKLRDYLKMISNEYNTTILISSHNLTEIENICDRVIMLNKGEIIEDFGIEHVKYKNISLEDEFIKDMEEK